MGYRRFTALRGYDLDELRPGEQVDRVVNPLTRAALTLDELGERRAAETGDAFTVVASGVTGMLLLIRKAATSPTC